MEKGGRNSREIQRMNCACALCPSCSRALYLGSVAQVACMHCIVKLLHERLLPFHISFRELLRRVRLERMGAGEHF